jgi:predicted GTPase
MCARVQSVVDACLAEYGNPKAFRAFLYDSDDSSYNQRGWQLDKYVRELTQINAQQQMLERIQGTSNAREKRRIADELEQLDATEQRTSDSLSSLLDDAFASLPSFADKLGSKKKKEQPVLSYRFGAPVTGFPRVLPFSVPLPEPDKSPMLYEKKQKL